MSVRLHVLSDFSAWAGLREEWKSLALKCPTATPFQTPEWLLTWWEFFGSGELLVFAFREEGRLVGLAPLFILPWNGRRQVTLIGSGLSDYLDFLFVPGRAPECLAQLFAYLHEIRSSWDLCDWQDLPVDSVLLKSAAVDAIPHVWTTDSACSRLSLPPCDTIFEQSLPHGLRRNLRRYTQHLERCGPVRLIVDRQGSSESISALLRFHRERRLDHSEAPFSDQTGDFVETVCARFAAAGKLRVFELHCGDCLAAGIVAFAMKRRAYGYLTAFNSEYERFSPGALLLRRAISRSIDEGLTCFDFLRGDESYKFNFGAEHSANFRLTAFQNYATITSTPLARRA